MTLKESAEKLAAGDTAPDFSLPGVDGETYLLDDFSDYSALLLVFTCNHCPYAQAKIPVMNNLAEEYDDVAVVGVNPNETADHEEDSFEHMQELVEQGEIRYDAYLRDKSQQVAKEYGAVCTPDPFLFGNEGGTFVLEYHGRFDDALNPDDEPSKEPGFEMRQAIESVLAGEPVEQEFQPSQGCSIKWRDGNEPDYW
ncbi:MAG: thioredoxin family protein [Candidatus Nanohaloarchaea archaeon]|nr:thioredoxin family protein [Candidatus Nanohaloarchaea archaeon]